MNKTSFVVMIAGIAVTIGIISALLVNNHMAILTGDKIKGGEYTGTSNNSVTVQSSDTVKHYAVNLSDSAASTSHT